MSVNLKYMENDLKEGVGHTGVPRFVFFCLLYTNNFHSKFIPIYIYHGSPWLGPVRRIG